MSDETPWDSLRPVVPEGMHLRHSRDDEGRYRALLFENDTNKMVGPPELENRPDDDDANEYVYQPQPIAPSSESDEELTLGELVAVAAVVAGIVGIIKAAPHVTRWWQEKAVPSLTRTWNRLVDPHGEKSTDQTVTTELEVLSETATADFSTAVGFAIQDNRTPMSTDEAQQRLAAMLAAAAFIAQQMRLLSNARLEDDAAFPALKAAMEHLTTQQVTDSINLMLESNTNHLLDDALSVQLMTFFGGGGRDLDGQYVPLKNDRVRDALRLPTNQPPDADD